MASVALAEKINKGRAQRLIEGWKTRIEGLEKATGKSSFDRRLNLAYTLSNTKREAKMHEAIQTPDAGIYKMFALDMVGAVVQNIIAPEIVSMQPMDNEIGMVLYLEYKYGTNKGAVKSGDVFADTKNFYKSDAMYSSNSVVNESIALTAGATQKFKLAQEGPIHPNTIELTVTVGGTPIVFADNGAGQLTSVTSGNSGKINYSTGEVELTLASAAAVTDTCIASYDYAITYVDDTASSKRIPEVTLQMKKIPMIAKPRRMKAVWSFESGYILNKEYNGTNMEEIMNATVSGEIMHEIDSEVMLDLYVGANAGPEVVWNASVPHGISVHDHYNSFKIAVDRCGANIYKATRKVRGNFLVGGVDVATVCSNTEGWKSAGEGDQNGPYFAGTLSNGVKVYVNPDYDNDVFVVGYKGKSLFETGYILGMYMPVCTTAMVQLEDMAGRKGWASWYGKVMVNNRMYQRGRIVGLN